METSAASRWVERVDARRTGRRGRGWGRRRAVDAFAASGASRDPFARARGRTTTTDPFGDSTRRMTSGARTTTSETKTRPTGRYPAFEDARVYEVPERLRRPGSVENDTFVVHKSLEDVFPGSGLADAFHGDGRFRTGVRLAMRDDLFVPNEKLSEARNAAMRALSSSVHVNWFESRTGYAALSAHFALHGVNLTGERFIKGLGALCGEPCHGTLIDIASIGKQKIRHSWHQDSGYDRFTVMLGFPASTPSEDPPPGVGVFTHAVKLSHPLVQLGDDGSVIQWEDFVPYEGDFADEYVARPVFKRGQEIMVYRDSAIIHSAPDQSHREAVWRFM